MRRYDVAVVGAGIVGLAHAFVAARAGGRVILFERGTRATGASVRNFGMVWPIGQPAGTWHETALRSRTMWLEAAWAAGFWVSECGSLHLAYRRDEMRVLEEFVERERAGGREVELLDAGEVRERSPAVRADRLLGGVWSPAELCVDPREAIAAIPRMLERDHGVALRFGTVVTRATTGRVETSGGEVIEADRVFVCSGDDFLTLWPEPYAALVERHGIVRCKLQMLRTDPQPEGWRLGPHLAGGLTLRHYESFEGLPSLAALRERIATETPEYDAWGVHVMASQNRNGEIVIGDSHEYDADFSPDVRADVERLILDYLAGMLETPHLRIGARWWGSYAKPTRPMQQPGIVETPCERVHVVTGVGGAGMTLSFGVAERVCRETGVA